MESNSDIGQKVYKEPKAETAADIEEQDQIDKEKNYKDRIRNKQG